MFLPKFESELLIYSFSSAHLKNEVSRIFKDFKAVFTCLFYNVFKFSAEKTAVSVEQPIVRVEKPTVSAEKRLDTCVEISSTYVLTIR